MDIRIDPPRTATREDLPEIADLLRAVFPKDRDWTPELAWQYLDNPSGPAWYVNARGDGGELVGHYAVIAAPTFAEPKLERYRNFLSLNTAVHPKAQGKGLFKTTATALFDHLATLHPTVILGVANANSVGGFVRSLGFFSLGRLSLKFFLPWQTPRPQADRALVTPPEVLAWRARRPGAPTVRNDAGGVLGRLIRHKGIPIEGVLTAGAAAEALRGSGAPERSALSAWLRLYACSGDHTPGGLPVPERFRPSPLHYICRVMPETNESLVVNYLNASRFEFIDFDVM